MGKICKTQLEYRYPTYEYRIYTCKNGRKYKVYKNGLIVSCEFELTDRLGRKRFYDERQCIPTLSNTGYFEIFLGGRKGVTDEFKYQTVCLHILSGILYQATNKRIVDYANEYLLDLNVRKISFFVSKILKGIFLYSPTSFSVFNLGILVSTLQHKFPK